jgi:hypothetical protein
VFDADDSVTFRNTEPLRFVKGSQPEQEIENSTEEVVSTVEETVDVVEVVELFD